MHHRKRRRRAVLTRFVVSYGAAFLLSAALAIPLLSVSQQNLVDHSIERMSLTALRSRDAFDARRAVLDSIMLRLSSSDDVRQAMTVPTPTYGDVSVVYVYYAFRELSAIIDRYEFLQSLQIVSFQNEVVVGTSGSVFGYERFGALSSGSSIDVAGLPQRLSGLGRGVIAQEFDLDAAAESIRYIWPIYYTPDNTPNAAAIIEVNIDAIGRLFRDLHDEFGGFSYVSTPAGLVLTTYPSDVGTANLPSLPFEPTSGPITLRTSIGGRDSLLVATRSAEGGLDFGSVIPFSSVVAEILPIRNAYLVGLLVFLILGATLTYCLARRDSTPLQRIAESIRQNADPESTAEDPAQPPGYRDIMSSLSKLVSTNEELQAGLKAQRPVFRNILYERLITGRYRPDTFGRMSEYLGIPFDADFYVVAVVSMRYPPSSPAKSMTEIQNLVRLNLLRRVEAFIESRHRAFSPTETEIVLFLTGRDADAASYRIQFAGELDQIANLLEDSPSVPFVIGVGTPASDLEDIETSYNSALRAVAAEDLFAHDPAIWAEDLESTRHGCAYPLELETRIVQNVCAGSIEGSSQMLDRLYRRSFLEEDPDQKDWELLITQLAGSLERVLTTVDTSMWPDRAGELVATMAAVRQDTVAGPGEKFHRVRQIILDATKTIVEHRRADTQANHDRVVSFINDHYADSMLCLAQVADVFGLTESHLSAFFKNRSGVTFSNYLLMVRMERARDLLTNTHDSISTVAAAVGYASDVSFRRAFKRFVGISPSTYRSDLRKSSPASLHDSDEA